MQATRDKYGVLLVNLGTPDSPSKKDVKRYLNEFLTDKRVIDIPWLYRQLLVRCKIVPSRYQSSAATYSEIWTNEGSPLLVYGKRVQEKLQKSLGDQYKVELAMRYQNPSIKKGLEKLKKEGIDNIIIFPLFPQYASATTGSIHEKVMDIIKSWNVIPSLRFIQQFSTHPAYINAILATAKKIDISSYDHVIFSYHGLPERHLQKADCQNWCLRESNCCQKSCKENQTCYAANCYATTRELVKHLRLVPDQYTISFQSRLGKEPWTRPNTSEIIEKLAIARKKKVLVFCPSFVCDCLETLYEIKIEYGELFKEKGGEKLDLVYGLNDNPEWIEALRAIITQFF